MQGRPINASKLATRSGDGGCSGQLPVLVAGGAADYTVNRVCEHGRPECGVRLVNAHTSVGVSTPPQCVVVYGSRWSVCLCVSVAVWGAQSCNSENPSQCTLHTSWAKIFPCTNPIPSPHVLRQSGASLMRFMHTAQSTPVEAPSL